MNIIINDKMQSLPFASMPNRMTLYIYLLCMADECGIVRSTINEMYAATGVMHPSIHAAIEQFIDEGLVERDEDTLRIKACRYWKRKDEKKKVKVEKSVAVNESTIYDRIAAFKERFANELKEWLTGTRRNGKSRVFPADEQDKFVAYWTAYNKGDVKFRAEREKKFYWQSRISTWMSDEKQEKYVTGLEATATRKIQHDVYEQNVLANEERLRKYKESRSWLDGKPDIMTPVEWLHELRERAARGDRNAKSIIDEIDRKVNH